MVGRKPDTYDPHTAESILHVASELARHVDRLRTAASLLSVEPTIPVIKVRFEASLKKGREQLSLWIDEVARVAHDERLEAAKKQHNGRSVRKTGHVSGGSKKGAKIPAEMQTDGDDSHS